MRRQRDEMEKQLARTRTPKPPSEQQASASATTRTPEPLAVQKAPIGGARPKDLVSKGKEQLNVQDPAGKWTKKGLWPASKGREQFTGKEQTGKGANSFGLPGPGSQPGTWTLNPPTPAPQTANPFLERMKSMYPSGGIYKPPPKPQLHFQEPGLRPMKVEKESSPKEENTESWKQSRCHQPLQ